MKKNRTTAEADLKFSTENITARCLIGFFTFSLSLVLFDLFFSAPGRGFDGGISSIFNLTREDSLGNWYGSTLTFLIALLVWAITIRLKHTPSVETKRVRVWFATAVLFTYTAIDDGSRIHEGFGGAFERRIASQSQFFQTYWPTYHWQLLFGPIFGLLLCLLIYIGWKEMKSRFSQRLLFAGLCFLVLGVSFDFVEGIAKYTPYAEYLSDKNPIGRHLLKVCEETIETFGFGLLFTAFLNHLMVAFPNWKFKFD